MVVTEPLQVSPALMIIDQNTGNLLPAPVIPPSTLTGTVSGQNPQSVCCDCFTRVGQPMVDSDGSTYVEYNVRQATSNVTRSAVLSLLKIAPDGTAASVTQLTSSSSRNDGEIWPGVIIPDGQGGVLATWIVGPSSGSGVQGPNPYRAAHVTPDGGFTTYILPLAPTQVASNNALPIDIQLVLGENGVAFVTYPLANNVVSFNLNSGAVNWNYQAPSQTSAGIIAATDNGGVAINNLQQGVFQLDASGTATQVTSGSAVGQPSYSWTGQWYAGSVSGSTASAVVLPLALDAAGLWATPGGNPSESGFAGPFDPSSFQSTDPPPPSTICPTCKLQSPNCLTMAGLPPNYLILVKVNLPFKRAANSRLV